MFLIHNALCHIFLAADLEPLCSGIKFSDSGTFAHMVHISGSFRGPALLIHGFRQTKQNIRISDDRDIHRIVCGIIIFLAFSHEFSDII